MVYRILIFVLAAAFHGCSKDPDPTPVPAPAIVTVPKPVEPVPEDPKFEITKPEIPDESPDTFKAGTPIRSPAGWVEFCKRNPLDQGCKT